MASHKLNSNDTSGRSKIVYNVLSSWGSHLIFVISGFIMPRLINDYVGQASLGIWDFCWTIVSYLHLSNVGVASSINRYIANSRAKNDINSLRTVISSVIILQIIMALVVLLCTGLVFYYLPLFLSNQLGEQLETARWVILLLGCSVAFQMAFDTSRGVLTGYHRWDLHNGLTATSYVITTVLMITALVMGKGLLALSSVYLFMTVITEMIRLRIAKKICSEYRLDMTMIRWTQAKELLFFGGKTMTITLQPLLIIQTTNIIVTSLFGPAVLALFVRPLSLTRHVETFIKKFSYVLTPTAGSLQGNNETKDLQKLLLDSAFYGVALSLPMFLILIIYGDILLALWMGDDYANWILISILALGYFLPVSQSGVLQVLIGINQHGKVALYSLLLSITTYIIGIIFFSLSGWTIESAAILIACSLTIGNGIAVPLIACQLLKITITSYVKKVFFIPLILGSLFSAILIIFRITLPDSPYIAFFSGTGAGLLVLGLLYWKFIFPEKIKKNIIKKFFT